MFGRSKVEKIKREHPIERVIEEYGVQLKKKGNSYMGRCPFHDDKNPSMSVSSEKGLFNCFACSASGDVITFVEKMENISNRDAIQRLSGETYQPVNKVKPPPQQAKPDEAYMPKEPIVIPVKKEESKPKPPAFTRQQLLEEVIRVYHDTFNKSKEAQAYLQGRGFNDKRYWSHFKIGYCDGGTIKKMMPESGPMVDLLKEIGVLNDASNPCFYKCIIFPIYDANGVPQSLYGRAIEGKRQCYTKGSRGGVWNGEIVKGNSTVIVTESILDAYSLIEIGFPNTIPVYGCNGFTKEHLNLFESNAIKEVILCLDNDDAGNNGVETIRKKLEPVKCKISRVTLPAGIKDPNDYLQNGGDKSDFQKLIKARSSLDLVVKKEQKKSVQSGDDGLIQHNGTSANFKFGNIGYSIKGFKSKFSDTMRVVISAKHQEIDALHTDRIDLYTSRNRKSFANSTAGKFNVQTAKVEDDLLKIVQSIESIKLKNLEMVKQQEQKSDYVMTDEERHEALEFLQQDNLVQAILDDLELFYIGEPSAKLLCYFSAVSRITKEPISITVRALSSSGKSMLLDACAKLMPPESIKFYSRISQNSLYYMDKDALKHCVVIVDEKDGVEGEYSMRTLLSSNRLVLGVVTKNPESGEPITKTIEVDGTGLVAWDSTTSSDVNNENLSRVFEIWLNSTSTELTEKIHASQRRQYSLEGWKEDKSRDRAIRVHRNAQRLLQNIRVHIPYHDKLSFPSMWTTSRRHNKRFLSLLSVIALTHSFQRERKSYEGIEYIEATKEDYRICYNLTKDILQTTLSPLSKEAQDLLEHIFTMVEGEANKAGIPISDYVFSRKQLREFANWTYYKSSKCLNELYAMEYLERKNVGAGGSFRYRLLTSREEVNDNPLANLTHPDEL